MTNEPPGTPPARDAGRRTNVDEAMCDRQSDVRIQLPVTPAAAAEVRRVARVVTGHEHVGELQR